MNASEPDRFRFDSLAWCLLPSLADSDRIIDTIDYGTDTLSFDKFDEMVLAAIKERDAAQEEDV